MKFLNEYKLNKNITERELYSSGFRNNTYQCYIYKELIKLVVHIDIEEKWWSYSVVDESTKELYPAYYNTNFGKNEVVKTINYRIKRILNQMVEEHILVRKNSYKNKKKKKNRIYRKNK